VLRERRPGLGEDPGRQDTSRDDQDPNFPATMGFRHASVGTSSLNRIASASRLLLPLASGQQ
jgi:hypothetical protein